MKKNIGSKLALYPMPITVIGAMNGNKPTWTLVGHLGIIGHDRVMVSLAAPHFINGKIKETKKLSINLVDENILPQADYVVLSVAARRINRKCLPMNRGRRGRR